jgi:imidazolonepropionase
MPSATLLRNIGLLLNPREDGAWEEIRGAAILFDERIQWVGTESEIPSGAGAWKAEAVDAGGRLVTPGLVDSHTHPAFAEPRAGEFELRNRGKSYREIAAEGGGIRSSVRALRALSEDELVARMMPRLDRFLELGTTTIEAKSGYGLATEHELKQLRAIRRCQASHPLDLLPTLLAAHEVPDEFRSDKRRYLDIVIHEMIPAAAEEKLAVFCDVFCEEGVFSVEEAREVLEAGKKYRMIPRLHADQLSDTGGAVLAAELGAASADHLDYISQTGLEKMVEAGVMFTLLPGAVLFLGLNRFPPVQRIVAKGGKLALATDFNPGSSPTQNLPLMMTLACSYCKLSVREALWAATRGGARALRIEGDVGSLDIGRKADLVLWTCEDERLLPYYFGVNQVGDVYKNGVKVVSGGRILRYE